jgi:hypothetical protein
MLSEASLQFARQQVEQKPTAGMLRFAQHDRRESGIKAPRERLDAEAQGLPVAENAYASQPRDTN